MSWLLLDPNTEVWSPISVEEAFDFVDDLVGDDEIQTMLDDVFDLIEVCGVSYGAGEILRAVDPIHFAMERREWVWSIMDALKCGHSPAVDDELIDLLAWRCE